VDRRRFVGMLGALGFGPSPGMRDAAHATPGPSGDGGGGEPEVLRLSRNGWMPNNERLSVLLYRGVQDLRGADPAARFEELFTRNGWPPQWRDGVYDFHHYHSTAHEGTRIRRRFSAADAGWREGTRGGGAGRRCCGVARRHRSLPAGGEPGFPRSRGIPAGTGVGYMPAGSRSRGGGEDGGAAVPVKRSGVG